MEAPSHPFNISRHAVDRWRERVDTSCRPDEARQALARFVGGGRSRPTPRAWMSGVRPAPGLRFIYSADRPGVCVLARDGTALTVLTKSLCRARRRRHRSVLQGRRCTAARSAPPRIDDWAIEEAA
jgi:hypothetical protein